MASSPPPTYEQATGGSVSTSHRPRNGISPSARRSMEDEARPLPPGWIRCFDQQSSHQFFVDTTKDPPRSIWQHPYDDKAFVDSLPDAERVKLQGQGLLGHTPSKHDLECESTDEEIGGHAAAAGPSENPTAGNQPESALTKFGRKAKDRLTRSTHAERQARRQQRAAAEEEAYRSHLRFRQALEEAVRTGQPQLLGVDEDGRELYLQPPGAWYDGVLGEQRLSSYVTEVFYAPGGGPRVGGKSARFVRADGIYGGGYPGALGYGAMGRFGPPPSPYARPPGRGYGGGTGFPLAIPLLGGVMLGGLLF